MNVSDHTACYRALRTKDTRFDGRLFVGITSTGIYCRPVCPARPAKAENCRFFASAAAAQEAGFRPCLRCRPETAPDGASWRGTANTVSRALALIGEGADPSVELLAERLGVGARQLRRLFEKHLGASPIAVAQTRRVLFAKQLLHETQLPMTEVALASGFGSIRRFNETFQMLFKRPPSSLRRSRVLTSAEAPVTLRLRYRPPYDWGHMLAYFEARAIDGVEEVTQGVYRRTASHEGHVGIVEVAHEPQKSNLLLTLRCDSTRGLTGLVTRARRVFDVAADIEAIGAHLCGDPLLRRLVSRRPGLRVPGAWDGFELALRAVLGQQVTLEAGRRLASRLVELCGARLARSVGPLSSLFPDAASVASADLSALGMPAARRQTLKAVAVAALADPMLFHPLGSIDEAITRLRRITGIGEWTAQYIALRAMREPDAFPSSDVGLLRAATPKRGARPTSKALLARSEAWRPWRAYAAQHLWASETSK